MATNRMLLIHRPSGLAVYLGKRWIGSEWYDAPEKELIELFYKEVEKRSEGIQEAEDFCIGMEDCAATTPYVYTEWKGYRSDDDEPRLLQVN